MNTNQQNKNIESAPAAPKSIEGLSQEQIKQIIGDFVKEFQHAENREHFIKKFVVFEKKWNSGHDMDTIFRVLHNWIQGNALFDATGKKQEIPKEFYESVMIKEDSTANEEVRGAEKMKLFFKEIDIYNTSKLLEKYNQTTSKEQRDILLFFIKSPFFANIRTFIKKYPNAPEKRIIETAMSNISNISKFNNFFQTIFLLQLRSAIIGNYQSSESIYFSSEKYKLPKNSQELKHIKERAEFLGNFNSMSNMSQVNEIWAMEYTISTIPIDLKEEYKEEYRDYIQNALLYAKQTKDPPNIEIGIQEFKESNIPKEMLEFIKQQPPHKMQDIFLKEINNFANNQEMNDWIGQQNNMIEELKKVLPKTNPIIRQYEWSMIQINMLSTNVVITEKNFWTFITGEDNQENNAELLRLAEGNKEDLGVIIQYQDKYKWVSVDAMKDGINSTMNEEMQLAWIQFFKNMPIDKLERFFGVSAIRAVSIFFTQNTNIQNKIPKNVSDFFEKMKQKTFSEMSDKFKEVFGNNLQIEIQNDAIFLSVLEELGIKEAMISQKFDVDFFEKASALLKSPQEIEKLQEAMIRVFEKKINTLILDKQKIVDQLSQKGISEKDIVDTACERYGIDAALSQKDKITQILTKIKGLQNPTEIDSLLEKYFNISHSLNDAGVGKGAVQLINPHEVPEGATSIAKTATQTSIEQVEFKKRLSNIPESWCAKYGLTREKIANGTEDIRSIYRVIDTLEKISKRSKEEDALLSILRDAVGLYKQMAIFVQQADKAKKAGILQKTLHNIRSANTWYSQAEKDPKKIQNIQYIIQNKIAIDRRYSLEKDLDFLPTGSLTPMRKYLRNTSSGLYLFTAECALYKVSNDEYRIEFPEKYNIPPIQNIPNDQIVSHISQIEILAQLNMYAIIPYLSQINTSINRHKIQKINIQDGVLDHFEIQRLLIIFGKITGISYQRGEAIAAFIHKVQTKYSTSQSMRQRLIEQGAISETGGFLSQGFENIIAPE